MYRPAAYVCDLCKSEKEAGLNGQNFPADWTVINRPQLPDGSQEPQAHFCGQCMDKLLPYRP